MKRPSVLVVDDEPDLLTLLEMTLSRMDLATLTATNLAEARAHLAQHQPDLCLTDMKLPDGNGLDLIAEIQQHTRTTRGDDDRSRRAGMAEALKLGAFDFVNKPVALDRHDWSRRRLNCARYLGIKLRTH